TYPFKPHCSLGNGIWGCTPMCEPTSYFPDGKPAGYKTVPCYHEEASEFQKFLFRNWFSIPFFLFIFFSFWIYKEGLKKLIKRLMYIAFAPFYIFKENRENKNFFARLVVIFMLFFMFIEWALGYYVAGMMALGKEPFNFSNFNPPQSLKTTPTPSFTGQDVLDAVNRYRKENNVPELKLDEVLCNNIAQRYLDIKSGEKENIAHKGFDEWYKKYAEPYGYSVSENYACGQTAEDIIKAWSGSPSHNLSILDKKNKVACTYASEGCAVLMLGYKSLSSVKGTQTNSDQIVNCQISPECGGGSRQMKLSECNKSTCCQIGDKWYLYLDKDKCIEDQKNNSSSKSNSSNKVPIYIDDDGGITKGTFYCYEDKVNELSRLQNDIRIYQAVADSCFLAEKGKAEICSSNCTTEADIAGCVNNCWANVTVNCKDKSTKVGDLRKELYYKVREYCP
ncbi:MAG: CAP domain-containing protein, partial [Candidatus Methanomethylicia archaeon]